MVINIPMGIIKCAFSIWTGTLKLFWNICHHHEMSGSKRNENGCLFCEKHQSLSTWTPFFFQSANTQRYVIQSALPSSNISLKTLTRQPNALFTRPHCDFSIVQKSLCHHNVHFSSPPGLFSHCFLCWSVRGLAHREVPVNQGSHREQRVKYRAWAVLAGVRGKSVC